MHPCAPGNGPCVEEAVCSGGARQDKACRRTPPFGGTFIFFRHDQHGLPAQYQHDHQHQWGRPRHQCQSAHHGQRVARAELQLHGDRRSPTRPASAARSEGRTCTVASECPGGTCIGQCVCASQKQPNQCGKACVAGAFDTQPCATDADCDPRTASAILGTAGTIRRTRTRTRRASARTARPTSSAPSRPTKRATSTAIASPLPACPFCQSLETCENKPRSCFVNTGISRIGSPGPLNADRETAAIYCVPMNGGAIDISAGFPGPGALIQRESVFVVP